MKKDQMKREDFLMSVEEDLKRNTPPLTILQRVEILENRTQLITEEGTITSEFVTINEEQTLREFSEYIARNIKEIREELDLPQDNKPCECGDAKPCSCGDDISERLNKVESKVLSLTNDTTLLKNKVDYLTKDIDDLSKRADDIETELNRLDYATQDVFDTALELKDLINSIYTVDISSIRNKLYELQNKIENIQNEDLTNIRELIAQAEVLINYISGDINRRVDELQETMIEHHHSIKELESNIEYLTRDITTLLSKTEELGNSLAELPTTIQDKYNTLRALIDNIQSVDIAVVKQNIAELRQMIEGLDLTVDLSHVYQQLADLENTIGGIDIQTLVSRITNLEAIASELTQFRTSTIVANFPVNGNTQSLLALRQSLNLLTMVMETIRLRVTTSTSSLTAGVHIATAIAGIPTHTRIITNTNVNIPSNNSNLTQTISWSNPANRAVVSINARYSVNFAQAQAGSGNNSMGSPTAGEVMITLGGNTAHNWQSYLLQNQRTGGANGNRAGMMAWNAFIATGGSTTVSRQQQNGHFVLTFSNNTNPGGQVAMGRTSPVITTSGQVTTSAIEIRPRLSGVNPTTIQDVQDSLGWQNFGSAAKTLCATQEYKDKLEELRNLDNERLLLGNDLEKELKMRDSINDMLLWKILDDSIVIGKQDVVENKLKIQNLNESIEEINNRIEKTASWLDDYLVSAREDADCYYIGTLYDPYGEKVHDFVSNNNDYHYNFDDEDMIKLFDEGKLTKETTREWYMKMLKANPNFNEASFYILPEGHEYTEDNCTHQVAKDLLSSGEGDL